MYIMAGLLVIGFVCNLLVKAVHDRFHMPADRQGAEGALDVAAEAGAAVAAGLTRKPAGA
jgi:hypothetical protein